jgi:hypothetical protein
VLLELRATNTATLAADRLPRPRPHPCLMETRTGHLLPPPYLPHPIFVLLPVNAWLFRLATTLRMQVVPRFGWRSPSHLDECPSPAMRPSYALYRLQS